MNNFDMQSPIYLSPGQIVMVRHEIENRPKMFIVEKVSRNVKNADGEIVPMFLGMRCRWFDKNQTLQEGVFSTKDLIVIE